jgi:ketosteroid isomerase-like protein
MSTTSFDMNDIITIAENYYKAMLAKDFDKMTDCLHDDIHFIGPLFQVKGKEDVIHAAKNLDSVLQDIQIRARCANHNQVMFAFDCMFPDPVGKVRAAALMEFTNQRISKIEIFFDPKQFGDGS